MKDHVDTECKRHTYAGSLQWVHQLRIEVVLERLLAGDTPSTETVRTVNLKYAESQSQGPKLGAPSVETKSFLKPRPDTAWDESQPPDEYGIEMQTAEPWGGRDPEHMRKDLLLNRRHSRNPGSRVEVYL